MPSRSFTAARHGLGGAAIALLLLLGTGCGSEAEKPGSPAAPSKVDLSCPGEALSPAPLRRLTRFEYANAVRDVFGTDLSLEELFPRDEVALGFDNQSGTLGVTDLHVQGYFEAANTVADWLVADPARLEAVAGCSAATRECARTITATIGGRLKRRTLSEPELDVFDTLFGDDLSPDGFRDGVRKVVGALLESPEFLYRIERGGPGAALAAGDLASPSVLASRLAFLIWGSVPDRALLDSAAGGRLASAEDVAVEARRLLADEKARRGVLHFYLQWLDLTELDQVDKDTALFTFWDETLRADLGRETTRFLEGVLWEDDARLNTLLTAPYTFANAVLEDLYGLPITNPDSAELVRFDFDRGEPRLGLLTQGSILARQAKANQTDPIHRGKFIRQKLFCMEPAPPPANLVVSPPHLDPRKTTRERFAEHRANPACGGCHELLDPVGLIFEHYDATGRYRETENGAPVDATGYLEETDITGTVDGVPDLAQKLAGSAQVRQCVIEQWFHYAFGRGETEADACTLQKLDQAFVASHGDLTELVVALTQTDPFLHPTPAPEPSEDEP